MNEVRISGRFRHIDTASLAAALVIKLVDFLILRPARTPALKSPAGGTGATAEVTTR